jgi:hypothetical protein
MQFAAGDKVILESTGERGLVLHGWNDRGVEDYYVAFFGDEFPPPGAALAKPPYVLRYAATSLRRA